MELGKTILAGWPDTRSTTPEVVLPYFSYRDELTIHDGVLYRGDSHNTGLSKQGNEDEGACRVISA